MAGFLWPVIYVAAVVLGVPAALLALLFVYSFCTSACCYRRRAGKQPDKVPYKKEVELYINSMALDCQKLRACLEAKEVDFEVHDMGLGLFGCFDHLTPEALKINPNGSCPFLVHEGHPVLGHADELINYIDKTFDGEKLIPETPESRANFDHHIKIMVETLGGGVRLLSLPAVRGTLASLHIRPLFGAICRHPNPIGEFYTLVNILFSFNTETKVPPEVIRGAFAHLSAYFNQLEKEFNDKRKYVMGDSFCLLDVHLALNLNRLEQLGLFDMMMAERGCIRAYWERLKGRKGFEATFRPAPGGPGQAELQRLLAAHKADVEKRGPVAVYGVDETEEDEET